MRTCSQHLVSTLFVAAVLAAGMTQAAAQGRSAATAQQALGPSIPARPEDADRAKRPSGTYYRAAGITLALAEITEGRLIVEGMTDAPNTGVTLDGRYNTSSGSNRAFRASLLYTPEDCILELKTQKGRVRVVVGKCAPQGDPGPQGETGPRGPKGATGDRGPKGDKGETGERGPKGETGERGPKGDTGAAGPIGPQGPQGTAGPQGAQGPQGVQGATGPAGATGATGPQGAAGGLLGWVIYDTNVSEQSGSVDGGTQTKNVPIG
jgi:hypothetical protein